VAAHKKIHLEIETKQKREDEEKKIINWGGWEAVEATAHNRVKVFDCRAIFER
jgi:hypothetical protein